MGCDMVSSKYSIISSRRGREIMNEKKAKQMRRDARIACEKAGVPLETIYKAEPHVVEIDGSYTAFLRTNESKKRKERRHLKHDLAKAARNGVTINLLLQELFGPVVFTRNSVKLGTCLRGVVQRTKKHLV